MGILLGIFLAGWFAWAIVELVQNLRTFFKFRNQVQPMPAESEGVDYSGILSGIGNGLSGEPICHESVGECASGVVESISHFFHH